MSLSITSSVASVTTADGISIAYTQHAAERTAGSPLRPRIALIHSLALDRSIWNGVVPLLTPHADVLTFDCRGHGQSSRIKMKYTLELFASDLAGLLDHVSWPRAVIAGCSMGGCVAQAFAGVYPGRVEALAVIDSTAWYGPTAPPPPRPRDLGRSRRSRRRAGSAMRSAKRIRRSSMRIWMYSWPTMSTVM